MSEGTQAPEFAAPLKTWSFAKSGRRKPSEYDIVSRHLHNHMDDQSQPFHFPNIPMSDWYIKNRNNSPLKHDDWDSFTDPDKLVYRTYNILQDGQETYIKGLFDQMNERGHDEMLSSEHAKVLARLYTPARYAYHTLQLSSAYLQQMAPSSTITNCATYQTADELRILTHTAYRTKELSKTFPDLGFGKDEREIWENDPAWQGIRELMEKALVAWDWAETFVVLNLLAKPALEESIQIQFGNYAKDSNDTLLGLLSQSQYNDSLRHRKWTTALVKMAEEVEGNKKYMQSIITKWLPLTDKAIEDYCNAIPDAENAASEAKEAVKTYLGSLGFTA
jgi:toluene monooxygenase system protein E